MKTGALAKELELGPSAAEIGPAAATEIESEAAPELRSWLIARLGMVLCTLHKSGKNTPIDI